MDWVSYSDVIVSVENPVIAIARLFKYQFGNVSTDFILPNSVKDINRKLFKAKNRRDEVVSLQLLAT